MGHFAGAAGGDRLRVLVAEEDARLRKIIRLNLEHEGFETVEASTLAECRCRLRDGDVDLLILSSHVAGFDAERFSSWLRAAFPARATPVLILSFEPEDRQLIRTLRPAAFRRKPFDPNDLVGQVSAMMRPAP